MSSPRQTPHARDSPFPLPLPLHSSPPTLLSPPHFQEPDTKHTVRIFTLRRKDALAKHGITHVVSVLKYDFTEFEDWEKYEHLGIDVDDVADEDLLGEFERTGSWIERALKEGKGGKEGRVLVHW